MKPLALASSVALAACLLTSFGAGGAPARAQATAPAEAEGAGEGELLAAEGDDWRRHYEAAHEQLRRGDFPNAASQFDVLERAAVSAGGRTQARAFGDLARFWVANRLVLVPSTSLGAAATGKPAAPFVDRRSTDELAVLYTEGVFYGIGTGIVLATYTKPSSPAGAVLPALAFAGATEGLIALLDKGPGLRYGAAQAIASGLFLGLEEGVVWMWWDGERHDSSSWSAKTVASLLWLTSTTGGVLGGVYGQMVGTTPGRMAFTGSSALWSSLVVGFGTAAFSSTGADETRNALLGAALALNVGTIGGAILAREVSPSVARARFIDLGGVAGGVLFGGLYLALADRDSSSRGMFGALSAGIASGVVTSWLLTRQLEPDDVRDPSRGALAHVTPTIAPTSAGNGVLAGLGGVF